MKIEKPERGLTPFGFFLSLIKLSFLKNNSLSFCAFYGLQPLQGPLPLFTASSFEWNFILYGNSI